MEVLSNIQKNIDNFKSDTLKLDDFLTGSRVSYSFFKQKFPEVEQEFSAQERNETEVEGMGILKKLNNSISDYEVEIIKYCFINTIARTDVFLNDIADSIYLWKKPNLDEKKRSKELLNFSHWSFKRKLEHLETEFSLVFPEIQEKLDIIMEIFSTRNLLLHNNGVVNETYLKLNEGSGRKVGDKRVVTEDYFKLTIVLSIIIAKSIEQKIKANTEIVQK